MSIVVTSQIDNDRRPSSLRLPSVLFVLFLAFPGNRTVSDTMRSGDTTFVRIIVAFDIVRETPVLKHRTDGKRIRERNSKVINGKTGSPRCFR